MSAPPLFSRLILGAATRERQPTEQVIEVFREEAAHALKAVGIQGAFARIALAIPRGESTAPTTPYDELLDHGLMNGVRLGGVDVALDVAIPAIEDPDVLVGALAGLADRRGDVIDVEHAVVMIGTDFVILDGDAPLQLFYFMRRNRSLTHDEFIDTWRDQHTKIAQFTPGLSGYRQLHGNEELSLAAACSAGVERADVDGVALEWFSTIDAFISATSAPPEFLEQAKASEARFNDLERATGVLTRVHEQIPGVDS